MLRAPVHEQGFTYFEHPTGAKEGSTWVFLLVFPDMGQKEAREEGDLEPIRNYTSKIQSHTFVGIMSLIRYKIRFLCLIFLPQDCYLNIFKYLWEIHELFLRENKLFVREKLDCYRTFQQ